jgi:hypothetical protein
VWVVLAILAIAAAAAAAWLALRPAAPGSRPGAAADADRARALYWLAADARDEATPIETRVRALEEDLAREEATRAPGWRPRREEILARLQSTRVEVAGPHGRASDRRMAADQALASARVGNAAVLAIHRAEAIRSVLDRDASGLDATVLAAARMNASDPWIELARAQAAVDGLRPADVPSLERAVERHPELVRGRVLLARFRHAAGDEAGAIRLLDEALALQPDEESAKAWKARYLAPPPASVSRVQVIGSAPPVLPGGHLPRLRPRS